jgi:leader peptidase (prepilin peptidase)/N-methyltransferase
LFPEYSCLIALVIGAAAGSFLNMLIYRLPRRLSFWNPPKSFCPRCKHPLHSVDLVPLFSWLSTGGRCRYCKEPIAVRYFLVELLMGGLYTALWWRYMVVDPMGEPLRMSLYMAGTAALVAIIFIDWELFIIPDEINGFLLLVGVGMGFATHNWMAVLWGAIAGWGILWGIALLGRLLFRKDAMGHGDIKMMRGVGAILGPLLILPNMAIAVVGGLTVGVTMIVIQKTRGASRAEEPEPEEEGEAALMDLGMNAAEVAEYKSFCDRQGGLWASTAVSAKKAGAKSYADLMRFCSPEPILSLLKFGLFYLLCLDLIGIFWHGIYLAFGEEYQDESIEDDTWTPSLTTIPFGPYLALGALVCMLFADPLESAIRDNWEKATNPNATAKSPIRPVEFVDSDTFKAKQI